MPRLAPWLALAALAATPVAVADPQASPPPAGEARQKLADEMDAYLWKHVLKPRFPLCVDKEHGGFHMGYGRDWSPQEDRGRFIVYEARVVWTAATVARLRSEARDEHLGYVRHGVRYLADVMWDREHGGFHTFVDLSGREAQGLGFGPPSRPVYGQAFAVYGLAAAHAATRDAEPLELAKRGWRWIEDHYRDGLGPGYASAVKPDGGHFPLPKGDGTAAGTSIEGPAHHRTMNDHIHLLEAYAELLRSWPDPELRRRTEELLAFVRDTIFVEPGCLYIALWPNGKVVPAPVSFGHDVETAFLMIEAEEALGRDPSAATLRAARMLVDQALAHGYDPARGQLFESGSAYGRPLDRSIEWWGQFEAFHAFQLMDELFGREDDRYRTAFGKAWALARDAFADPQHPGVCPRMDERGEVHCDSKSHMWFVSYHTARSLLFTADRLRRR
jgi:cellobiose epimerase